MADPTVARTLERTLAQYYWVSTETCAATQMTVTSSCNTYHPLVVMAVAPAAKALHSFPCFSSPICHICLTTCGCCTLVSLCRPLEVSLRGNLFLGVGGVD